jgi:DNA replication protein DnaC
MTPLEQKLQQLNLKAMSRQLETTIADAAARNLSVSATIELLADVELDARNGRAIERRFKLSRLQTQATIDAFHFHHHKSRVQAKNRILRLLDLAFLKQGTNLVLIGNPGVGKTFLARVIGSKACQANQRVLFTTAMDMLNHLLASQVDHSLVRKLKTYTDPTLLIVDELGYLSLDQQTSNLFYQVVSTRHSQKRSTIITTNTPFSDWATSSLIRPSRPPSQTGWSRTPKSSCSAAKASVRPAGTQFRRKSSASAPVMRRSVR